MKFEPMRFSEIESWNNEAITALTRGQPHAGGISRTVYIHRDFVVKVDEHGWCNQREVALWKAWKGTDLERYLAPVLEWEPKGAQWLVMQKVEQYRPEGNWAEDYEDLENQARDLGIEDCHDGNVGYLNGRLVVCDYGFLENELLEEIGWEPWN